MSTNKRTAGSSTNPIKCLLCQTALVGTYHSGPTGASWWTLRCPVCDAAPTPPAPATCPTCGSDDVLDRRMAPWALDLSDEMNPKTITKLCRNAWHDTPTPPAPADVATDGPNSPGAVYDACHRATAPADDARVREAERAVVEALPTRGDVGRPEATRDPVFLLQVRDRGRRPEADRWRTDGVWFTREEAEAFAAAHVHRWPDDRYGKRWHVYCVPADGDLARLLKAVTKRDAALRGKGGA